MNKRYAKIILILSNMILYLLIINTIFYIIEENKIQTYMDPNYILNNVEYGFENTPNSQGIAIKKFANGTIIFKSNYSIDNKTRRINPYQNKNKSMMMFGGSFVYGYGLDDNETLPSQISKISNTYVYNLGTTGYGTQQLPFLMKSYKLDDVPKNSDLMYVFINNHIKRVEGNIRTINWSITFPYYYISKNELIYRGSFEHNRTFKTKLLLNLNKIATINFFKNQVPSRKKYTYLTYKLVQEAKHNYEMRFNGTFYVLIHPIQHHTFNTRNENEYFIKLLKQANITVLEYPINVSEDDWIRYDGHPTSKFNEKMANFIVQDLNLEK